MNLFIRGFRMAGEAGDRRFWTVVFLASVDFCCVLLALERYDKGDFVVGTVWLTGGVVFSIVGFKWPQIRAKIKRHRATAELPASDEAQQAEQNAQQEAKAEVARRQNLLQNLRHEYILSHDNLSPALVAGVEQPPPDWVNQRLAQLGERWIVAQPALPEFRPRVLPVEYMKAEKNSRYGLYIRNPGYDALDVEIPSVRIGQSEYSLVFHERLAQFGERSGNAFLEAWLEPIQGEQLPLRGGGDLHEIMRNSDTEVINFGIIYKDTDFRSYRTKCSIERTNRTRNGLEVKAISQEMVNS